MATSVPYAAGAKIALPDAQVLNIMGDGGAEMHVSAFWLLAKNDLDIPVILMNNRSYGQVFEWLQNYHEGMSQHADTSVQRGGPYGLKIIPDFEGIVDVSDGGEGF